MDDNAWGYPQDQLEAWKFHVDWVTPANSTFTSQPNLATASFVQMGSGIPQPGTPTTLDTLSDRLMYRLAYRNFGDHEALVVNHTVSVSGQAGVRWYELRRTGGNWSINQQGTYAPAGGTHRWMGSVALDKSGNLALGMSASSSTVFPSIYYAGRLAGDPAGTLTMESTMTPGGGSQLAPSRWGDYSSMSLDPSDDCTFWYTTEYYSASASWNWQTRIASFRFPQCGSGGSGPTVTSFTPTSGPAGTGVTITGTGFTGATAVKFNVTNASYTFNSDTQITATVPSGATTGKISVTTPGGTGTSATNFTVTGGGGGPTITSFTPTSGPVGKIVTINGTGFTGATAVKFNGTSAATWFLSSATKILARVPTGATTGPISVTKPSGTGTSATNFTVTGGGGGGGGGPTITSFTPTSGPVGVIVTINGTGFTGATAVKFNGKPITQGVVNSATKITARVPTGATTGPISVTTPSGTGTSASNFTVG
jgi:hypothetical protein